MKGFNIRTAMYYLVGAYIAYLAFCIMNNRVHGDETMSWPVAVLFTAALGIGAVGVIIYAIRQTRKEMGEDSELEQTEDTDEKNE